MGEGACHQHMGAFSKLHMPTSSQDKSLIHPSGRKKGMLLFFHMRISAMVNPSNGT